MIGIYKIISPTNKIYIGQSTNIEKRFEWYKKIYCKNQTKLYNSLKKYGPENHKFEIIEECNEEQLLEKETYWKLFYKVLEVPSLCCRIDGKSGKLSKETKLKISKSNKGISRNKGRIQNKNEKTQRSHIRIGYEPSKTHINNMSKSMMGKNSKIIVCINTNIKYSSIREASKELNISERSISNILLGFSKQTKNKLIFKYI
jgi:group I intron endonuclease